MPARKSFGKKIRKVTISSFPLAPKPNDGPIKITVECAPTEIVTYVLYGPIHGAQGRAHPRQCPHFACQSQWVMSGHRVSVLCMFYLLCVRSVTRMQKVSQTAAAA
jgi:hypothetical protein